MPGPGPGIEDPKVRICEARYTDYAGPVAEVEGTFPRAWVEFVDPDNDEQLIRADLTWLTSRWHCIFGDGCPGVYAGRPHDGCCTHGAHFSDAADRKRVLRWSRKLTAATWQQRAAGRAEGIVERDEDGAEKTRVVDGVCIFFNGPDFPGGYGCALHHLAEREGVPFVQTKPDVCWQLPLRREYDWRGERDGTQQLVITLTEYTRAGWGEGGHEFDWYCSANTEAHTATEPVYRTAMAEITELIGPAAAGVLAEHCAAHEESLDLRRSRQLPLLTVHPATVAAPPS